MNGEVTALVSAACYGISNLLLRKGQKDTYPSDNGLFPILLVSGTILLFTFIIDLIEDPAPLITGNNWAQGIEFCILSGVAATLFGRLFLYTAISRIGATRGAIFIALSPFVTLVIALTILGETFRPADVAGTILLFTGILLLLFENKLFPSRFATGRIVNMSILIACGATLFQGIGYSFRKIGVEFPIDPVFASTLDTWTAILVYTFILTARGKIRTYVRYYTSNLNLFVICAGFVMAAAVCLFFEAVMDIPVSTVSVIMGSQPVIVALLAGLFMNELEQLTWITFASSILVCFGVILLGI